MLTAIGVTAEGKRSILGCSVAMSEAEPNWRKFLESLLARGMRGVKLVVSDDHAGLKASRSATLSGVLWLRCQFHTIHNAIAHAPTISMRDEFSQDLKRVFDADDDQEATRRLRQMTTRYQKSAPALANWLEKNLPEALTVLGCPPPHRRRLRTTNGVERLNKES